MPHSNDIQMMINHVNNNDNDKYSHIPSPSHEQAAATSTSASSSSLSYDSLCLLLLHRDAKEMRHLRQLLRQHLTWREHLMEWSKFLLNIIVAVIAVIVGIQTLQSRVTSVQTAVDALTGSVNQVSGNVEKLSTSIEQSQQDVMILQNNAAGLNHTMIGMNEQLYDIQILSSQLAYNVTKLNVSEAVSQVQGLDTQINLLTNQSIVMNDELIHARIQLFQQNISTYTTLNELVTTSQLYMTSLITSGQTNLSHYIQIVPTIVTTLLQPIQQNLTHIAADVSHRVRSIGFCNYSSRTNGSVGGYVGVRSLCRTACSSMTARECTSYDIFQQYYTTGFLLPWAQQYTLIWISSPTTSYYTSLGSNKEYLISDCNNWSSAGDMYGNSINVGASYPKTTILKCNAQLSFACCDYVE